MVKSFYTNILLDLYLSSVLVDHYQVHVFLMSEFFLKCFKKISREDPVVFSKLNFLNVCSNSL